MEYESVSSVSLQILFCSFILLLLILTHNNGLFLFVGRSQKNHCVQFGMRMSLCVECNVAPDNAAGAGGGRGLLGGRRERALVLLAERIDGGVIVWGGGAAPLRGRLSADRLQAGAAAAHKGRQKIAAISLQSTK